ncbi:MAG: molybdopterin cofactor-binding domain-containing protein [Gammaproteobacteria bacterium]
MNRSRRRFLIAGSLLGGGLLVGYALRDPDPLSPVPAFAADGRSAALNGWVKIAPDGTVTVALPNVEMGQSVYTGLPLLIAEEMDLDPAQVRVEPAPLDPLYANTAVFVEMLPGDPFGRDPMSVALRWIGRKAGQLIGFMVTGGSSSMINAWLPMRTAGASARAMLVEAAARRWQVPARECSTEAGQVRHAASRRTLGYGDLAQEAAAIAPPPRAELKARADFRLLGRRQPRLDAPDKVTGRAGFGIDVRVPGMRHAAIAQCPTFGGRLVDVDDARVTGQPGIVAIVRLTDAVAVVADSHWRAQRALDALVVQWDAGEAASVSSETIHARLAEGLERGEPIVYEDEGDTEAAISGADRIVEAAYRVPFLAHATMEPMNCTARVDAASCEIWIGHQSPHLVRWFAARMLEMEPEQVVVHGTFLGGGFGRRAEIDIVGQALAIARALPGTPIQLLWSREQDMRHDVYRPAMVAKLRAGLDARGRPRAWWSRSCGPSVARSTTERILPAMASDFPPDKNNADGAVRQRYSFAARRVEHVLVPVPVPLGFWRSVGHSYNAFFVESFLDEVAHASRQDPYRLRRDLLAADPRALQVLDTAAMRAGWGTALPAGRGRGIAFHESFGSLVAQVAEVSIAPDGTPRVHRVVCAVDCGMAVDPEGVIAQMESGILYGLTAALHGAITIYSGAVQQSNFHDYPLATLAQAPRIEVHVVDSGAELGGAGEPGTPPIAPAVANAIFAATGVRVRELPIRAQRLRRADGA